MGISMVYIMKSTQSQISPIIIVSILFSLWSLTSRVVSDDKTMFENKWKDVQFSFKKCPIINPRYLLRTFWRFLEITNRIFVCTLIWINLGGLALFTILIIEFFYCFILCIAQKTPDA